MSDAPTNEELAERLREYADDLFVDPRRQDTGRTIALLRTAAARLSEFGGGQAELNTGGAGSCPCQSASPPTPIRYTMELKFDGFTRTIHGTYPEPPTPSEAREVSGDLRDLENSHNGLQLRHNLLLLRAAALIERLSKDAERYRWLRNKTYIQVHARDLKGELGPLLFTARGREALDAAIDAALKEPPHG